MRHESYTRFIAEAELGHDGPACRGMPREIRWIAMIQLSRGIGRPTKYTRTGYKAECINTNGKRRKLSHEQPNAIMLQLVYTHTETQLMYLTGQPSIQQRHMIRSPQL